MANLFDWDKPLLRITKPVRLIECFSGIGAQAKAFERLGVPFEHWRSYDFDKYAVRSYNAIHGTAFEPADIREVHGADLGITDTDKFEYVLTYSFPCQDLSCAGKMRGMKRGEGTRSGLLWEIERILNECQELPQILLMENVPMVVADANIKDFAEWVAYLERKGYTNSWQILNAKDYGVPQNRERCFMVSFLGEFRYEFPCPIPLPYYLGALLDETVDDKYYIKGEAADKLCSQIVQVERERELAGRYGWAVEHHLTAGTHVTLSTWSATKKRITKPIKVAYTILARDYKGWQPNRENTAVVRFPAYTRKHHRTFKEEDCNH